MREIKFRAWNIGFSKMSEKIEWIDFKEGTAGCVFDGISMPILFRGLKLMQYTGLKDKNGKEIYEGDIIRAFDENYEVKFKQTKSGLRVDYGYPDYHNGPAPDWVEVIGNIRENPKLINAK